MEDKLKIAIQFDQEADCILFEGDCLQLLSTMPNDFFKLIVTSPPYNLGKVYENRINLKDYIAQQQLVIQECVRTLDEMQIDSLRRF